MQITAFTLDLKLPRGTIVGIWTSHVRSIKLYDSRVYRRTLRSWFRSQCNFGPVVFCVHNAYQKYKGGNQIDNIFNLIYFIRARIEPVSYRENLRRNV